MNKDSRYAHTESLFIQKKNNLVLEITVIF